MEVREKFRLGICNCGCGESISITQHRQARLKLFKWGHSSRGSGNGMWKGGRIYDFFGYVRIYKRDHPFADKQGYVKEHRYVMEEHLGRYLDTEELVHHVNGKKDDNRIENLQLMTKREHGKHHNTKDMGGRKCSLCNSSETYYDRRGWPTWFKDGKDGWHCRKCHAKAYNRSKT